MEKKLPCIFKEMTGHLKGIYINRINIIMMLKS